MARGAEDFWSRKEIFFWLSERCYLKGFWPLVICQLGESSWVPSGSCQKDTASFSGTVALTALHVCSESHKAQFGKGKCITAL